MTRTGGELSDDALLSAFDAAVAAFARLPVGRDRTPVPSCPGWDLAALQEHLGQVHRWANLILTTKPEKRPVRDRTPLGPGADRHAFVAEGAAELRERFLAEDLDEPVWTFVGRRPARWWLRRQAQETTLHALDAIDATGEGDLAGHGLEVSPELAVDGVDELLDVFVPLSTDSASFGGTGETLHLHATDADGEWLVRFEPDAVTVTREHAKGDVAARGPALDLLRLIWGRTPGPGLTVFGDATILDRFRASSRF
jgi:uncharacterized protein (TIGR03083 family)